MILVHVAVEKNIKNVAGQINKNILNTIKRVPEVKGTRFLYKNFLDK